MTETVFDPALVSQRWGGLWMIAMYSGRVAVEPGAVACLNDPEMAMKCAVLRFPAQRSVINYLRFLLLCVRIDA